MKTPSASATALAALLLCPLLAAAEQEEEERDEAVRSGKVEEVQVVASPIIEGNQVDRYGNQTTTVTKEQIRDLNAQDPQGALRRTPGVVISRHNPVGSFGGGEGGAIYIRGLGGSRPGAEIATLVDGVPVFVGVWTHPLMDVLNIDAFERIDVHKGANPVFLGNMTFGAADFATKRWGRDEGAEGRFGLAAGSWDTWIGTAEHGGRKGRADWYVVGSYRTSDGHRENADGELAALSGRFGWEIGKRWQTSLYVSRTDNKASDPGPVDGVPPADGVFKVNDWLGILTFSNDHEACRGDVKVYWNDGDIDWEDQYNDEAGLNQDDTLTDYENYGLRARQTFEPWPGGEIVAGLDWDTITGSVEFRSAGEPVGSFRREEFEIAAPYAALSHRFETGNGWHVTPSAGLRFMTHSEFQDTTGWQAGLVAGRDRIGLHASLARAYNYPGIYVAVMDDQFLPGDNRWQDLEPERVDHLEAGFAWEGNRVRTDVTLFRDDVQNRIVIVPPPPFPPVFDNVESYRSRGVEATVTWSPGRKVALFAGATWLETDREVPYAPKWTASAGFNVNPSPQVRLNLDAAYVGDRLVGSWGRALDFAAFEEAEAYFVANLRFAYLWESGAMPLELYVFVENLTDEDYEMKAGYPMPGIGARIGINVRF